MAAQDWQSPYPTSDPYAVAAAGTPPPPYASRYELRPLAAGEVLDRVFSLYRSHFWFFAGLSAVSAGVSAATAILRLIYLHFVPINLTSPTAIFANSAIGMVQGVVYLIAYSLTHAAISSAVQAFYLGEPTSFEIALKVARRLWLRCLGIAIWQAWSGIWVFLALLIPFFALATFAASSFAWIAVILGFGMFGSVIYGVIAYLRNSLAVPAAVVEDLGVRAAMRRSKRLATGRIGRIFLLILLFYAMWFIAGLIQLPLAMIMVRSQATQRFVMQALVLGINFFATTLVGPIGAIGLCLFYFDERVRREGFDIEVMLRSAASSAPPPPAPGAYIVPEELPNPIAEQT